MPFAATHNLNRLGGAIRSLPTRRFYNEPDRVYLTIGRSYYYKHWKTFPRDSGLFTFNLIHHKSLVSYSVPDGVFYPVDPTAIGSDSRFTFFKSRR